jgi:hypothetical protein
MHGYLALVLNAHLPTPGHGVGQLLHQEDGRVFHPHEVYGPLQERQGRDVGDFLQFGLHDGPQVFTEVEIWGFPRLVHDADLLLPQQGHHLLAGVTRGPELEELGSSSSSH